MARIGPEIKKHSHNSCICPIRVKSLILTLMWLLLALPVLAQEGTPSADEVNRVAKGLYCPVCENVPLDVCPTAACVQWRETIRQKLAEGWTDAQIKDYFAQQYGDRVLAAPPARGLNWLVYLLPPLILLGGAVLVFGALRRRTSTIGGILHSPPLPPVDEAYAARLEAELARRK